LAITFYQLLDSFEQTLIFHARGTKAYTGTATDNAISLLASETTDCLFNTFEPKIIAQVSTKEKYRY